MRRLIADAAPGDIILLHDKASARAEGMLNELPHLIDEFKARGFAFVLVQ